MSCVWEVCKRVCAERGVRVGPAINVAKASLIEVRIFCGEDISEIVVSVGCVQPRPRRTDLQALAGLREVPANVVRGAEPSVVVIWGGCAAGGCRGDTVVGIGSLRNNRSRLG